MEKVLYKLISFTHLKHLYLSGTLFSQMPAEKYPYPKSSGQKVKRRLAVAKKSGRLDFSTSATIASAQNLEKQKLKKAVSAYVSDINDDRSTMDSVISCTETFEAKNTASRRIIEELISSSVDFRLSSIPDGAFLIKGITDKYSS